jgi:hypothetical protein
MASKASKPGKSESLLHKFSVSHSDNTNLVTSLVTPSPQVQKSDEAAVPRLLVQAVTSTSTPTHNTLYSCYAPG